LERPAPGCLTVLARATADISVPRSCERVESKPESQRKVYKLRQRETVTGTFTHPSRESIKRHLAAQIRPVEWRFEVMNQWPLRRTLRQMKPLSIQEIEDARKCTADNAMDLISGADVLLKAGHAAQSFFLAHGALEEIAKIPMLVGAAHDIIAGRTIDWKEVGKRLESHREKIEQTWIGLHINADEKIADAELLAKARNWFSPNGPARVLREHALYAGVVNMPGMAAAFKSPAEVIDTAVAEQALAIARQVVANRVREEELSRGNLARTPPGFVEAVEQHIGALMEAWRDRSE
jgi:AbiV family abortive infection protein